MTKHVKYDNTKEYNFQHEMLLLLSKGFKEYEIHEDLERRGYSPNSLSHIEKTLQAMRKEFRAKTTTHLVAKAIRMGLI